MVGGGGLDVTQAISLLLVGALWGCTNPLLLRGSKHVDDTMTQHLHQDTQPNHKNKAAAQAAAAATTPPTNRMEHQLTKFRYLAVWLPYVINQGGSLVFYLTLSQTGLSLAGPACNGLALVFSVLTSWYIGEKIHRPIPTILGAGCVVIGVAICTSRQQNT